ncbi:putative guanyl-specific ribonuclease f1 [Diplodia seriata]|uniref:Putative guanyl-specific ribonuclease f1 n=1 Tax=Diplodia seriata TaxID=420778 RepID=A0A0G2GPM7_9PEZI|nr:putative guanyl-specific ribonuclease f1 [Diplodia seriata]
MPSIQSLFLAALCAATGALAVTCGSNTYTDAQISSCVADIKRWDERQGPGAYPHKFNNYEGLAFGAYTGVLYEFPLLTSGPYRGGAPGADRCVAAYDVNTNTATNLGAMTHTGAASRNGFVKCT